MLQILQMNKFSRISEFCYNGSWKYYYKATAESVEQAQALIDAGADRIYVMKRLRITIASNFLSYGEINRIAWVGPCCWQRIGCSNKCITHQSMMDSIALPGLKEIREAAHENEPSTRCA